MDNRGILIQLAVFFCWYFLGTFCSYFHEDAQRWKTRKNIRCVQQGSWRRGADHWNNYDGIFYLERSWMAGIRDIFLNQHYGPADLSSPNSI